jgi:hypothetical protein
MNNDKLPYWEVVIWAMLQPIAALITIVLTIRDTATMVWRNRPQTERSDDSSFSD